MEVGPKQLTVVPGMVDATFVWDYAAANDRRTSLYQKATRGQWSVDDIDWSTPVPTGPTTPHTSVWGDNVPDTFPLPASKLPEFLWEYRVWLVSQFLHGEQGALLTSARLVEVLPDIDAKKLAASQVIDEARHVDVYARYVTTKLGAAYPVNPSLEELLRQIVSDQRWDLLSLGMQIIIEGLALAAFRLSQGLDDPLITDITERIARDEARHVSFGMLQLTDHYDQLSTSERRDREDFVLEAAQLMARRFDVPEVWERLDVDAGAGRTFLRDDPTMSSFRQILFSRVTTSVARLGLMTDHVRDGLIKLALYRPVFGERRAGG